jgi:hypothetical protein
MDRWRLRNGATPARRLGWLRIRWCPGRFQAECGHLFGFIPHLQQVVVAGAGAELCRVGSGGRAVIVVCRSLRKDGDGDSAMLMNCPGRISCEPKTASAGENSLSSLKEALMPNITQGRRSCQSAAAARDRKAPFSDLWNRSTNPFDCGWYAVVGECWMLAGC